MKQNDWVRLQRIEVGRCSNVGAFVSQTERKKKKNTQLRLLEDLSALEILQGASIPSLTACTGPDKIVCI